MVTLVSNWGAVFSNSLNQATPPPAGSSLEVPIDNTGEVTNWLFAAVAWRNPDQATTVAVGDDAHNLWHPLGSPIGSTPSSGLVRTAIWYTRSPNPASTVFISPNGYCPALVSRVTEYSGLSPWATVSALSMDVGSTVVSPAAPAPSALSLMFLLAAYDDLGLAIGLSGSGGVTWTSLPGVLVGNGGGDDSNDCGLGIWWTASTGHPSATITATGGAMNMAGLIGGVLVTGNTPVADRQDWPYIQPEAAFGAGAATPWDQLQWTNLGSRFQSHQGNRGHQYELDQIQSGTGQWLWSNNDGALMPGNTQSPYYLGVSGWAATSGTLAPSVAYAFQGQPAALFSPAGGVTDPQIASVPGGVTATWRYTAMLQLYSPAGWAPGAQAVIDWYGTGGVLLGSTAGAVVSLPAGEWTQVTVSGVPLGGALTASIAALIAGTPLVSTQIWIAAAPLLSPLGKVVNSNPWFSAGVGASTPTRLLVTWPPPPALNARTYSVYRGFTTRWPQNLTPARYQTSNAQSNDAWSLTTALLNTLPRAEILSDNPYIYCPLDDDAGASSAANLAPTTAGPLQVVSSKFGPGSAIQAFGADATPLQGDPSTTSWQVQGVTTLTAGYSLYTADPNLPSLAEPATIECWFNLAAAQPTGDVALLTVSAGTATSPSGSLLSSPSVAFCLYVNSASGQLTLQCGPWSGSTTTQVITTASVLTAQWLQVVLVQPAGTSDIEIYVNGVLAGTSSGPVTGPAAWSLSAAGVASPWVTGGMVNASVTHLAVFPTALDGSRIHTHYLAMLTALTGEDTTGQRIERLLSAGAAALPRCIPAGVDPVVGAIDIQGQSCGQNVVNIAESDSSLLMVDGAGYLFQIARRDGYNLQPLWTFGEQPSAPLNANPTFAGTVLPWTGVNGASAVYSSAWSYGKEAATTGSAVLTPDGVTANPGLTSETTIPVTAGTSYTGSAWVMSAQGWATGIEAIINWRNSGGGVIATTTGLSLPLGVDVPTQISVAGRAPYLAVAASLTVRMIGTPPSATTIAVALAPFGTTYTEQPYQSSVATGYDDTQVFNDVTLTQTAAPALLQYRFSAVSAANLFYAAGSALLNGQQVTLTGNSLPAPFVTGVTYYVVSAVGSTFQLAGTAGGSPISVSSNGSGKLIAQTPANGVTVYVASRSSISQNGDQTLQQSSYLDDTDSITDQGDWISWTMAAPQNRIVTLVFDPSVNQALWPVVLSLETGQVVNFYRRLGGTEVELAGQFQVMTLQPSVGQRTWTTSVTLVAYTGQILTCDDPVYGVLDNQNAFGW